MDSKSGWLTQESLEEKEIFHEVKSREIFVKFSINFWKLEANDDFFLDKSPIFTDFYIKTIFSKRP